MVLQKIILLTIFACVAVCAAVPITSRRYLARDEFLGQWFVIAAISNKEFGIEIRCFSINVTKSGNDDHSIVQDIYSLSVIEDYDYENIAKRYGKVFNSQVHIDAAEGSDPMTSTTYKLNNGQQRVLHDLSKPSDFLLISKTPTVPTEIMQKFRDFAALFNGYVQTFATNDCEDD